MKIDINKKYRYRNGDLARVLCVDAPGSQMVVTVDQNGTLHKHWADGAYCIDSSSTDLDLIEVREPREWEIFVSTELNNSYKAGTIDGSATEDLQVGKRRIPGKYWEIVRVREIIEP